MGGVMVLPVILLLFGQASGILMLGIPTQVILGVVLAVITIGVFLALGLLAGNITNAINTVAGYL
jgi:hypothetical protein